MGCKCKQGKKINNITKFNLPKYEKKGVQKIMFYLNKQLWKIVGNVIVMLFMILSIPFVSIMVILNYFKKGEMFFSLPFPHMKKQHNTNVQNNKV